MMTYDECKTALANMMPGLPNYPLCESCGHEHNCANEGCAIMRDTIATMEQLYKDAALTCKSCAHKDVSSSDEPCRSCGFYCQQNWEWRGVQQQKEAT